MPLSARVALAVLVDARAARVGVRAGLSHPSRARHRPTWAGVRDRIRGFRGKGRSVGLAPFRATPVHLVRARATRVGLGAGASRAGARVGASRVGAGVGVRVRGGGKG